MKNEKLRSFRRRELMMSRREAAHMAGISEVSWMRYENGIQQPHLSTIKRMCKAFDKTPQELGFEDFLD